MSREPAMVAAAPSKVLLNIRLDTDFFMDAFSFLRHRPVSEPSCRDRRCRVSPLPELPAPISGRWLGVRSTPGVPQAPILPPPQCPQGPRASSPYIAPLSSFDHLQLLAFGELHEHDR